MSSGVTIDMSGLESKLTLSQFRLGMLYQNIVRRAGLRAVEVMKRLSSHKTGRLRNSIQLKIEPLNARVGPTVGYATYLEHGTRASPGRYVKAIGKRLVNPPRGMHPGIKPHPFVKPTYDTIASEIGTIAQDEKQKIFTRGSGQ